MPYLPDCQVHACCYFHLKMSHCFIFRNEEERLQKMNAVEQFLRK
jgi:hypothetical protein